MRVAIAGAGIAGLAAAHRLDPHCDVVLYEAEPRAGGHAYTVVADGHALDAGFVVCNERNYPLFLELMRELGVSLRPSTMSFSVRCERCDLEFSGHGLRGLFAQRRNLVRPSFARLLLDLGRFFRNARALLDDPGADDFTIGEYLDGAGYGRALTDHFLAPMGAAIWSSSPGRMREMPARFFIHFFDNHGLLGVRDAPQWYTIEGGSQRYVNALTERLRGRGTYFATVDRLLALGGLAGIQAILVPDQRYRSYRTQRDWIRKHIFPGGMLPSLEAITTAARRSSDLMVHDVREIGPHYARTLREWRERFLLRRTEVEALGLDIRFQRTWEYYLAFCEAAFATHALRDAQLVLTRPLNRTLAEPV